jgi:hypothetical protein
MNITYLGELANGQNRSNPYNKNNPKDGSFAKKSIEHLNFFINITSLIANEKDGKFELYAKRL